MSKKREILEAVKTELEIASGRRGVEEFRNADGSLISRRVLGIGEEAICYRITSRPPHAEPATPTEREDDEQRIEKPAETERR